MTWKVTTSKSLKVLFTKEYPTLDQAFHARDFFTKFLLGTYSDIESV